MRKTTKIDYTKLLGFDTVSDRISDVDFRAGTVAAKLGAKVGEKDLATLDLPLEVARSRRPPSRPSSFALCSDASCDAGASAGAVACASFWAKPPHQPPNAGRPAAEPDRDIGERAVYAWASPNICEVERKGSCLRAMAV